MSFPVPTTDAIPVCWVDASSMTPEDAERCLSQLADNERDRFRRYRHPVSAHQFVVGRLLIRRWLEFISHTPGSDWRLIEGERGRPAIAWPASPWSFNLAHSGGIVACVLSLVPETGVDVEHLDRRPMARDLIRRFCSPGEIADIERYSGDDQTRRFLTHWTLKEAYLKARGLGITVQLADLEFSLAGLHPTVAFRESLAGTDPAWAFELFQPTARCLLSVAAPHPSGTTRPVFGLHGIPLETLAAF